MVVSWAVGVGVGVTVGMGVRVGVYVGFGVAVLTGVAVGIGVNVGRGVGVSVGEGLRPMGGRMLVGFTGVRVMVVIWSNGVGRGCPHPMVRIGSAPDITRPITRYLLKWMVSETPFFGKF